MTEQQQRKFSRKALFAGAALWTMVFAGLFFMWQNPRNSVQANAAPQVGSAKENPIKPGQEQASVNLGFPARKLPNFEFENCTGGTLSLDALKGKRWVASFVFSRCTTSCPVISAAVMKVHDRVKDDAPDVHFVSITVDPKYDTADVFREYSETCQPCRTWDRL